MDISATNKSEKKRKKLVDKCKCSRPGSEECVQVHVEMARSWIKDQLGEEAFKNCGLDAMGDQVGEQWTAVFKRKLEKVDKLIPRKKHQKFMGVALKELGQKETKNLAKYYYNVFLPRRLASLTRAKQKKDESVDTNDEKSGQEDEENERRPRKKSKKSFGSSSTRLLYPLVVASWFKHGRVHPTKELLTGCKSIKWQFLVCTHEGCHGLHMRPIVGP